VFWDASTVMLEDIERIEVISGPGGTIWGANAVNGVINIITRDAAATQGTLASITRSGKGGREAVRYGGTLGESGHFRIYGLATDRDRTRLASGVQRADDGSMSQVGFRADLTIDAAQLTLQGDAYHGGDLPASGLKPRLQGGNLLARWNSHFDDGSPYQIQAYYDYAARDETAVFRNTSRNASVEFRHEPVMPAGQHLLYGAGYRGGQDYDDPSAAVLLNPSVRPLSWANVFVQHQVGFAEKWQLTLGAKAERNSYTGTELLPSARVAFQHSEQNMTWAALSRAVRAPSRIDRDFFFPGNAPFIIVGGPRFRSEIANVVELGHKGQLSSSFTYSGTLFRQYYNGLRSGIPGAFPATVENQIEGSGQGVEASAQWQVQDGWRLGAGYFGLRKKLRFSSGVVNAAYVADLGNDPRDQWTLRSSHTIGRAEVDLLVRHVGQLPSPLVPAYTAVDARLAYRVSPALELSLLAQNLFERRHVEFNAAGVASQIEPRVSIKAVLQF
jgi:iron complex outermembrane receptor protein